MRGLGPSAELAFKVKIQVSIRHLNPNFYEIHFWVSFSISTCIAQVYSYVCKRIKV